MNAGQDSTILFVESILNDRQFSHSGVKGMKWGVKTAAIGAGKGLITAGRTVNKVHDAAVNSKVNQGALKVQNAVGGAAKFGVKKLVQPVSADVQDVKAVATKTKQVVSKAASSATSTARNVNASYKQLTTEQKAIVAGASASLALGAVRGASLLKEHGPAIIGTIKLAAHFAKASKGANFATKMLGDAGRSLPYAKLAQGAFKVTSLK